MAKTYTYLIRIPSGSYSLSSATYGLNGGENTVADVGTDYIEVSGTFQNFYPLCKVKIVEGTTIEYCVVSTVEAGAFGDLKLTFTNDIQNTFTTNALAYIESYFGFAYNTTSNEDLDEGYFYSDFLTSLSGIERGFIENCERGGSLQAEIGGNFSIVNTSKLSIYCEDNGIYLNNCPVYIFLKVNTSAIAYAIYNLGLYVITELSWNVKEFNISFSAPKNKRNAQLSSKINKTDFPNVDDEFIGINIPIVFGKNYQNGQYAKFVRCNSKTTPFTLWENTILYLSSDTNYLYYLPINLSDKNSYNFFPCAGRVGSAPYKTFNIIISSNNVASLFFYNTTQLTSGSYTLDTLQGQYLFAVEGLGEGTYRKIETAVMDLDSFPNSNVITITTEDYYETDQVPDGNVTATLTDNTWFNILDMEKQYVGETWECKSFLDTSGNDTTEINGYVYTEQNLVDLEVSGNAENIVSAVKTTPKAFITIPQASFSPAVNNTQINTNFSYLSDADSIDSFVIVPFESINVFNGFQSDFINRYGYDTKGMTGLTGLYSNVDEVSNISLATNLDVNNFSYVASYQSKVRDDTTKYSNLLIEAKLPDLSSYEGYTNAYLYLAWNFLFTVVNGTIKNTENERYFNLHSARFIGGQQSQTLHQVDYNGYAQNSYADVLGYNGSYFFPEQNQPYKTGYYNYEITDFIIGKNKYTKPAYFCINPSWATTRKPTFLGDVTLTQDWFITLYGLKIVLKKSLSVEKNIFALHSGRIFGDTWFGRKISTDLITNPIDILEHTIRLQNFSDLDTNLQIGKEYSPNALIKTTGTGGFDNATDNRVEEVRDYTVAFSLQEEDKTSSEFIKKAICKNYFLLNYTDLEGKECIRGLSRSETSPSVNFTLADLQDRDSIKIEEPKIQNIYCEPTVKYNWSPALEKFTAEINITNTDKTTYQAGYVTGVTEESMAETLWEYARELYLKTKNVEQIPEDMSNLYTVGGASGYQIALDYIYNLLVWQFNKRISFKIHLDKIISNNLDIGSRFTIALPHQTDTANIECILTNIDLATEKPYICSVKAILFSSPFEDYFIQDDFISSGDNEWEDDFTSSENNEINDNL